jgi:octaprenyl-diphosphate synthase
MLQAVAQKLQDLVREVDSELVEKLFSKLPQGKMLRSKLILAIAPNEEAVRFAAIVEMIHAASLLHDDVIDEATQRRGVESINALYGNKTAIMLGDILYSKAFFELTSLPEPIPQIVSHAVMLLSLGELMDVELAKSFNPDKEAYLDMIYKKTGSLIEASAKGAALLSGKEADRFGLYGKNLGVAFQIVDDILDITQDSATLGKPAMHDFSEGKTTLPYIYLYEALEEKEREKLRGMHARELTSSEQEWLKEKFFQTKALERAKEDARELAKEAMEKVEDEKLRSIMHSLIERTY